MQAYAIAIGIYTVKSLRTITPTESFGECDDRKIDRKNEHIESEGYSSYYGHDNDCFTVFMDRILEFR